MSPRRREEAKYRSMRVISDGRSFASKLEAAVFEMLKIREMAGELKVTRQQVHVRLTDAEIVYIPDFECEYPDGRKFFVEAKGFPTPEWKLKLRLYKKYGPLPLEIWGGSHRNPIHMETVIPNGERANGERAGDANENRGSDRTSREAQVDDR